MRPARRGLRLQRIEYREENQVSGDTSGRQKKEEDRYRRAIEQSFGFRAAEGLLLRWHL